MNFKTNYNYNSIGFLEALLLMFIFLKLTNAINWSWWWVLSPLLIVLALVLITSMIMGIIWIIGKIITWR